MPIYQKINKIMNELTGVAKDRVNSHKKYQYVGYDDVNEALRPLFAKHGVVRVANALKLDVLEHGTIQVMVQVVYVDSEDGSELAVPMVAIQPSQTTNKSVEAQQVGQAISYAVKNVELKLFALTGNPDSDDVDKQHDRSEREAIQNEGKPPPGAQTRFSEIVAMFRGAKTEKEVRDIEAMAKGEWADLKDLPGAREGLAGARNAALQRIA
jgi:hypothetical protein